jgi:nucleotide-binding universal stress UspA family protein
MSFATGLKTIVVATDLNEQSEAALEYARKLATNYGARIVLAHGLDPVKYAAVDAVPGGLLEGMSKEARAALDKLAGELLQAGIHSHSEVRQGTVAQTLVDVARQYQAGLIVIGTKGMEGAGPVVVGAVAEQLVRMAPCPVLAVAADWNAGAYRPTPGGPVLLAMERNEASAAAMTTAYSLASVYQRTLLVLHARGASEAVAFVNPRETRLEDYGIKPDNQVPVRSIYKDGNPSDVIVEAIAHYHPCILVAGVKRASDTPGPHGTAFSLLARSRVPVLCVPPETAQAGKEQEARIPLATM